MVDERVALDSIVDEIKIFLEEIRPTIKQDGGDIHFVRFENDIVYVKLYGACVHCPISFITLKMGIEAQLKKKIPVIQGVVSVDDEE